MKAKRFLSVLMAVMLMVSCFAIGASADADKAIIDKSKAVSLTITLLAAKDGDNTADSSANFSETIISGDTDVAGEEQSTGGRTGIENAVFELYLVDANGNISDTAAKTITTNSDGVATATELAQGKYKVVNTAKGTAQVKNVAAFYVNLPMTDPTSGEWNYDVCVYPKMSTDNSKPGISKDVAAGSNPTSSSFGTSASIDAINNQVATWRIKTDALPANISTYQDFKITDVIDPRLTADENSVKLVYDGSNALTKDTDYTISWTTDSTGYKKLVIDFTTTGIAKLETSKVITVTFETTIDIDGGYGYAAVGQAIANHVTLDYTNSGSVSGKVDNTPDTNDNENPGSFSGDDPDDPNDNNDPDVPTPGNNENGDPYIWTGAVNAVKVDEEGNALKGAEFILYKADTNGGTTIKVNGSDVTVSPVVNDSTNQKVTSDDDGAFSYKGLVSGVTYYLVETKAPTGYELLGAPISFEVKEATPIVNYTGESAIKNIPSTDLPLTGGVGTTMFAILGIAFVAVGGTFLFKSKKAKNVA